jgi:hypothetical protein
MRNLYKFLVGQPDGERDHLEDLGIDVIIILKCILKGWGRSVWTGFICLRMGTSCCEYGNEPSGSIKGME